MVGSLDYEDHRRQRPKSISGLVVESVLVTVYLPGTGCGTTAGAGAATGSIGSSTGTSHLKAMEGSSITGTWHWLRHDRRRRRRDLGLLNRRSHDFAPGCPGARPHVDVLAGGVVVVADLARDLVHQEAVFVQDLEGSGARLGSDWDRGT